MSATIKEGSDRTIVNQDRQQALLVYNKSTDKLSYVRVDGSTDALTTIDYAHHEVHSGSHYYIEGHTELGIDGTYYVKLVTPNTTKWAHFTWDIVSNGILETKLYEGASEGMADGNDVTPINNNRNSTNTSGMVITSGVTVATNLGTLISNRKVGGTGFKSTFGGSVSRDDELMLKQNTIYFRSFLSKSASNIIAFKAMWYEHTDRS
jgi:hypothetical protein